VLTLDGNTTEAAAQIDAALAIADERSLRQLRPAALRELVDLADQLRVSASRPPAVRAAPALHTPGARARDLRASDPGAARER
jgi:hypothetical protein